MNLEYRASRKGEAVVVLWVDEHGELVRSNDILAENTKTSAGGRVTGVIVGGQKIEWCIENGWVSAD
jgi:hypothetical protein